MYHSSMLAPATIADARHMLAPALADPDPVLIFEHSGLYNASGDLLDDAGPAGLDHAAIRRPGTDVTLITYGGSLPKTLAAAAWVMGDPRSQAILDQMVQARLRERGATVLAPTPIHEGR